MKFITREVKMYSYVFANIDVTTGQASNMHTVETPVPMGQRQIRDYSKDHESAIMIKSEEFSRKFSLPLPEFISACEDYAERVSNGEAAAMSEGDSEDTDATDEDL